MIDETKKIEISDSEVIFKVVLEISVVGDSRNVTMNIQNYPENFDEILDSSGSDELPLSYEIMQQVMNFITNEVGIGPYEPNGPHNYLKN